MVRIMAALAAWAAGTAIATGITWFGANVVLRDAGVGPGMPVVNAAVLPPAVSARSPGLAGATGSPGSPGSPSVSASAQASVPPASAPAAPSAASPSPFASAGPTVTAGPTGAAGAAGAAGSAGSAHAYTLTGGRVTLEVTPTSVQLVTAVPDAGYAVTTWSGTGWLRVDFSSGPQVSSLIASWYEHAPTVTVEN
jgi:hypothetical protein